MSQLKAADISDMLSQRISDLVRTLLPRGTAVSGEWRVGSLDGEPGQSLAVHLRGGKAGVWKDFASGDTGDALQLVAACRFNGDVKEALAWAKSWLGLDGMDPERLARRQREARAAAAEREADALLQADKMRRRAMGIWHGGASVITGTPVDEYLRARAIDVRLLPKVPGSLRFSAKCYNMELKEELPAMVAQIQNSSGEHVATHRTYLREENGRWRKDSRLKEAKKTLGAFRGGFITLNRGASGKPIKHAPHGDRLILCEGIEDGLSLALACPDWRVIAGVSLGNYNNITLPPAITDVTIAADNDGDNPQAARGLENAVARLQGEGRTVRVARSPVGKDFNDYLQAQAQAAISAERNAPDTLEGIVQA